MAAKKLVVVGGSGALGRGISTFFARSQAWQALSVDFSATKADAAHASFVLEKGSSLAQAPHVLAHIRSTCVENACWRLKLRVANRGGVSR